MTKLVFLDTETTSLRPDREVWDLGYIVRDRGQDTEVQQFVQVSLDEADPASLKIGRYYQRHPDPFGRARYTGLPNAAESAYDAISMFVEQAHDAVIVGAVPWFDTETLANLARGYGFLPSWHYHLVDVEALAAGHLGMSPPWSFNTLLARFGITVTERHSAIGDARAVRDLYDAIMKEAGDELHA